MDSLIFALSLNETRRGAHYGVEEHVSGGNMLSQSHTWRSRMSLHAGSVKLRKCLRW